MLRSPHERTLRKLLKKLENLHYSGNIKKIHTGSDKILDLLDFFTRIGAPLCTEAIIHYAPTIHYDSLRELFDVLKMLIFSECLTEENIILLLKNANSQAHRWKNCFNLLNNNIKITPEVLYHFLKTTDYQQSFKFVFALNASYESTISKNHALTKNSSIKKSKEQVTFTALHLFNKPPSKEKENKTIPNRLSKLR